MKQHKATHASGEPSAGNPFQSALNTPIAEAMGHGASVFGRTVNTFQQEGMRFMTRRIEQNAKAIEQFVACKSLPDLLSAQQHWFAEMTRAYSEELARYGELMTEALHEAVSQAGNAQGETEVDPPHRADVREH